MCVCHSNACVLLILMLVYCLCCQYSFVEEEEKQIVKAARQEIFDRIKTGKEAVAAAYESAAKVTFDRLHTDNNCNCVYNR